MFENVSPREKLFGTDGIRGIPGRYPLTNDMIYKIGFSIAKAILYKQSKEDIPKVIIGKDTRLSGKHIEGLLSSAILDYGIDVLLADVITTPGLSFLIKDLGANMGIMISASHNKPSDNGIKFFNAKGYKLLPEEERWIEDIIFGHRIDTSDIFSSKRKGKVRILNDTSFRYIKFLKSTVKGLNLERVRVALDCAWGASSLFAKQVFGQLGATIYSIHDLPQGENINIGGSIEPSFLRELVIEEKTDIGFAFDGDGDRVLMIDEKGNILDGDYILAIIAQHLLKQNKLAFNSIVATVMSNYGLKNAMERNGGKVVITQVGDKHVLEALINNNLSIGGEQSGHTIFLDYLPTPDGMLTALQILKVIKETQSPLSELAGCMEKFPQILINVKVKEKKPFSEISSVSKKLQYFNAQLKDEGRILLRYSGTESLARIMVEGKDRQTIESIAESLANLIREEIGCIEEGIRTL